jgi:hypothetical protein
VKEWLKGIATGGHSVDCHMTGAIVMSKFHQSRSDTHPVRRRSPMDSLLSAKVLWPLLAVPWLACYGRNHVQQEGMYSLTMTQIIRDECSLNTTLGTTWSGNLEVAGDRVWFRIADDRLFRLQFVGNYLASLEQFRMDASAGNMTVTARGVGCVVDLVHAHIDGTTDSSLQFHGTARLDYESMNPNCVCQWWTEYQAQHQS